MALRTRNDYFDGVRHQRASTEELARTSRMVARLTGYPVQYNKAIVGRNAFAHEAGIHQHGVLEDRDDLRDHRRGDRRPGGGADRAGQALGSPRVRRLAGEDGPAPCRATRSNQAFTRFKELADRKVEITEADLEAIVVEELGIGTVHRFTIVEPRAARRHRRRPRARTSCSPTATARSTADG